MNSNRSFLITLIILLTSCSNKAESQLNSSNDIHNKQTDASIKIESHSPDKTVKSRWLIGDYLKQIAENECVKNRKKQQTLQQELFNLMKQVSSLAVLNYYTPTEPTCSMERFERDISEVKLESDTRAIVYATIKNSTPIPNEASPSKDDLETREKGAKFKYVLEKMSDGWKITQIYQYKDVNRILNKDLWEPQYETIRKVSVPQFVFSDL